MSASTENDTMDDVTQPVTHGELVLLKESLQKEYRDLRGEYTELKGQIAVLQARAAAVESQMARIEPMVEARNSRTEKLVMELQIEVSKLSKAVSERGTAQASHQKTVEDALKTLLERTE